MKYLLSVLLGVLAGSACIWLLSQVSGKPLHVDDVIAMILAAVIVAPIIHAMSRRKS